MKLATKEFSSSPDESMRLFRKNNDIALLSRKVGTGHTVLCDMYNPDRERKLGYLEALGHAHITGDHRLPIAAVTELGYGVFKKPEGSVGDEEILDLFLGIQGMQGKLAETLHLARKDGVIDSHENRKLGAIIDDVINEMATLKAEMNNQVREVKSA